MPLNTFNLLKKLQECSTELAEVNASFHPHLSPKSIWTQSCVSDSLKCFRIMQMCMKSLEHYIIICTDSGFFSIDNEKESAETSLLGHGELTGELVAKLFRPFYGCEYILLRPTRRKLNYIWQLKDFCCTTQSHPWQNFLCCQS